MRLLSHQRYLLHDRIEALAVPALDAEKVPLPIRLHLLAVVAFDRHHLTKLRRDRLQRDPHRHRVPRRLHPLVRFRCLLAHGASAVVTRQLPEAVPVYGVPAGELMRGVPAGEQVLLANRAVAHVLAHLAVVIGEELLVYAHAAVLAVLEVLAPAHAAEAAVLAVVGTLLVGHPEVAYGAVILAKLDVAIYAVVSIIFDKGGHVRWHCILNGNKSSTPFQPPLTWITKHNMNTQYTQGLLTSCYSAS